MTSTYLCHLHSVIEVEVTVVEVVQAAWENLSPVLIGLVGSKS